MENVLVYEFHLRKSVIELMNWLVDCWAAFQQIKNDAKHYQINFLHNVRFSPNGSVTAPGMRGQGAAAGPGHRPQIALLNAQGIEQSGSGDGPPIGKGRLTKKNRLARLKDQLEEARKANGKGKDKNADRGKRLLAIEDQNDPPGKKGKGKGKGKDRAPRVPEGAAQEMKPERLCLLS